LDFDQLLLITQELICQDIFVCCVISIEIDEALYDITTSHAGKYPNQGGTLRVLPVAREDVQALNTVGLYVFEILDGNCLLEIHLLLEDYAGIPDFDHAIFSSGDHHDCLLVKTERVCYLDAIDWRLGMCLLIQHKVL
jgi:hypothetical protein